MLRKISTNQLRFGMYIQAIDGSWFSHPFWRTRFVLNDPSDLQALRSSGVPAVWIDTEQGVDIADAAAATTEPHPAVEAPINELPARAATCSARDEMQRASCVLDRSKQAVASLFNEARLGNAVDAQACLPVVEEISESLARNASALIGLARLKDRDEYTYMHSVSVCALMVSLARQLGLNESLTREAGLAGLLHDVGKMAMPPQVLNKPGKLTDAEFDIMRAHPERGHAMLVHSGTMPEAVLDVCLHHHEKVDGSGYPHGLKGEQISLFARMGAVCDVYDAITSRRPYKEAWDAAGSLSRMAQWKGHFDTGVFHAFVKSVGIYPLGTLVRLESGRLGVVVDQNPGKLTEPVLRLFYSTRTKMPIAPEELDLSRRHGEDRIVSREDPATWGFANLDDFWR
ncbi:HD-GYP domain-containing protein [Pseudomonas sp. IC_126]|uniref:HD-GYP domain-containing protein n=1 Tax=Pseudomonas sp. IC_126 TaxID=2547400 RepID=UPI00103FCD94|nr:HD-GYP domain-containing protein [Pseudomonas sp. IC_126]TCD22474.1 HD-GYP domain-containing protein [Pseudomonas sp. IC_126]